MKKLVIAVVVMLLVAIPFTASARSAAAQNRAYMKQMHPKPATVVYAGKKGSPTVVTVGTTKHVRKHH